jgi:hypothetical protein
MDRLGAFSVAVLLVSLVVVGYLLLGLIGYIH